MTKLSTHYSGVIINQNAGRSGGVRSVVQSDGSIAILQGGIYQEFKLPADYARSTTTFPALTGFQLALDATDLTNDDLRFGWSLEYKPFFGDWTEVPNGAGETATGLPFENQEFAWYTCLFDHPVDIADIDSYDTFRLRIALLSSADTDLHITAPSPLNANTKLRGSDTTTALLFGADDCSLMFRILSAVADSGTDMFGNSYRSAVAVNRIEAANPTAPRDTYWLSEPLPSQFAVVSKYYDLGSQQVVDRVLLDPLTPNVWCNVYWSNEGTPGADDATWDDRLWTPVSRSYRITARDTFVLPEPIKARYVKLEFSHLQARPYAPGNLQTPIRYRKHPKWVFDYFALAAESINASVPFVAREKSVRHNALELAYMYYQDDLIASPTAPGFVTPEDRARVVQAATALADQVDPVTRAQINTSMQPFLERPATRTTARTLLGQMTFRDLEQARYPVERLPSSAGVGTSVSSLNRDAVLFEQSFPVLSFYLTCRHRYREVMAVLSHDRAYFVGLKHVAFTRERYTVASDNSMYIETMGDFVNTERNDFLES